MHELESSNTELKALLDIRLDDLKQEIDDRATESKHRRILFAGVGARGFAGTGNSLEFAAGLFERLLTDRTKEIDPQASLAAFRELRADVERARAEALLLTDDRTAQLSALNLLTYGVGDEGTEQLLREGLRRGRIGHLDADELERAEQVIRERRTGRSAD
jgi:hypothetical protein